MGLMPKLIGISYFKASEKGARDAAQELGVDLDYDGPAVDSAEDQVKMIDRWIAQGYDMIAVAANDPEFLAPALRRASQPALPSLPGMPTPTLRPRDARRSSTRRRSSEVGSMLVDILGEGVHGEGKVVIITGSATSPNQNAWMKAMHARIAEKYPKLELLETLVSDEDQAKAYRLTRDVINAHADLAGIWAITSVSLPGAAKAVRDSGKAEQIFVTGLSQPEHHAAIRRGRHGQAVRAVEPRRPGVSDRCTWPSCFAIRSWRRRANIGRLKDIRVSSGEVLLGPPKVFDRQNVGQYDF